MRLTMFDSPRPNSSQPFSPHLTLSPGSPNITQTYSLVVAQILAGPNSPLHSGGGGGSLGAGGLSSSGSVGALKRELSQQRTAYLKTGKLSTDAVVLAYIARLEEHLKTCEVSAWFVEAVAGCLRPGFLVDPMILLGVDQHAQALRSPSLPNPHHDRVLPADGSLRRGQSSSAARPRSAHRPGGAAENPAD